MHPASELLISLKYNKFIIYTNCICVSTPSKYTKKMQINEAEINKWSFNNKKLPSASYTRTQKERGYGTDRWIVLEIKAHYWRQ